MKRRTKIGNRNLDVCSKSVRFPEKPSSLLGKISESMVLNGYTVKQRSKWISEALISFIKHAKEDSLEDRRVLISSLPRRNGKIASVYYSEEAQEAVLDFFTEMSGEFYSTLSNLDDGVLARLTIAACEFRLSAESVFILEPGEPFYRSELYDQILEFLKKEISANPGNVARINQANIIAQEVEELKKLAKGS